MWSSGFRIHRGRTVMWQTLFQAYARNSCEENTSGPSCKILSLAGTQKVMAVLEVLMERIL